MAELNPVDPIGRRRLELQRLSEADARSRRLEAMYRQVPRKFHGKRLADYRSGTPSQAAALRATEEWVAAVVAARAPMLALIGPKGVGKSHLLYGAAWALFEEHDIIPSCFRWYKFGRELQKGRGAVNEYGRPGVHPLEVKDELYQARTALIDEARETSDFAEDATALACYALYAYDEEVAVLLTTNMETLEQVMGEAPADRFEQVVIVAPSGRGGT